MFFTKERVEKEKKKTSVLKKDGKNADESQNLMQVH